MRSLRVIIERLAVAHVVAYPIAIAAAAGAIPLAIRTLDARGQLVGEPGAIGQLVVHLVAWPAGLFFLLAHLAVTPWLMRRDDVRGRRWFLRMIAALAGVVILVGGASWLWLVLR